MVNKYTHSCICIYKNCGIRSRDNTLNVRFYRLPVTDKDRLITWLINSGRDDLAEESDAELLKFRICSRHFPVNLIHPSGRLKKNADPLLYEIESDGENNDSLTIDKEKHREEVDTLRSEIERKNTTIKKLKNETDRLKRTIKTKNSKIFRLQKKLSMLIAGNLPNKTLFDALRRRVQGSLLTFITMQLFHTPQSSYTEDMKQLTKKMHYTSPSLYTKMRQEFNFILPGKSIINKWFSTIS